MRRENQYQIGEVAFDPSTGELWRDGQSTRLARQPARVLAIMAQRAGRLVTREELRDHVWPDTVVEFDDAINGCVRRIRRALGDDAQAPSYIETVPKVGYRLVAKVSRPVEGTSTVSSRRLPGLPVLAAMAAAVVLGLAGILGAVDNRQPPEAPQSVRHLPDETEAGNLLARGVAYWRRNLDLEGVRTAAALFRRSEAADSSLSEAPARLSIALYTLAWEFGQFDGLAEAAAAVARAESLAPDDPATLLAIGYHHYYGARRYDEAQDAFQRALRKRPLDPEILVPLAYVHRRKGEFGQAAALFRKAYSGDPNSFEVMYALATTYDKLRDHETASRWIGLAHAADPGAWFIYREMVLQELERTGDVDAGLELLKEIAPPDLHAPVVLSSSVLTRVYAEKMTGELGGHLGELGSDARLLVHKGYYWQIMGDSLAAAVVFDSARVLLERAGGKEPPRIYRHLPWEQFYLARVYSALGLVEETRGQVERLLEVFTPGRDRYSGPFVRSVAAEALVGIGDHDRAIDMLESLADMHTVVTPGLLGADPAWAPLREKARFKQLMNQWPGQVDESKFLASLD